MLHAVPPWLSPNCAGPTSP